VEKIQTIKIGKNTKIYKKNRIRKHNFINIAMQKISYTLCGEIALEIFGKLTFQEKSVPHA
jgi:hypothetical protein